MKDTEKIKRRYDRVAKVYDLFEGPMESISFKKWRFELTKDLDGYVLEVFFYGRKSKI